MSERPSPHLIACINCIHFEISSKEAKRGECHRKPPVLQIISLTAMWAWPVVRDIDWCSKFRRQI